MLPYEEVKLVSPPSSGLGLANANYIADFGDTNANYQSLPDAAASEYSTTGPRLSTASSMYSSLVRPSQGQAPSTSATLLEDSAQPEQGLSGPCVHWCWLICMACHRPLFEKSFLSIVYVRDS